jgi:hypothetical protein
VLLYFIVRVEVIETQIWFEFKLICNLQNSFEKEKGFLILIQLLGRNLSSAQPASLRARARRSPTGWRRGLAVHGRAPA